MLTLLVVLIAVAVVLVASAGLVVTRRRRGSAGPAARPEPEAPAAPSRQFLDQPADADPGALVEEAPAVEAHGVGAPAVELPAIGAPGVGAPAEETHALAEGVDGDALAAPPRFRDRLGRARSLLGGYLSAVRSRERIDDATWEELEEALILADVGATVTAGLLDDLRRRAKAEGITSSAALIDALKQELIDLLQGERELAMAAEGTTVWLFVGVNGVGKTTTIGKLGLRQVSAGHRVVMAAGDTFRAAAADQLETWAARVGATVIRGKEGGDPGAVVFDAVAHAAARGADLVMADTAGRLHTKTNLMEELKKVRRVAERPPGVVTEVLLVIDATTGQNGLVQAQQFASAVGVTGVVLTKLDGTAKGGIVVAIRSTLGIPIKLVGLGEGAGDLVDFDAVDFVEALFAGES
jgi:fused signal recognition particle receptor